MCNIKYLSGLLICIFSIAWNTAFADPVDEAPPNVVLEAQGSFICVFRDIELPEQVSSRARQATATIGGQLRHVYQNVIKGFSVGAINVKAVEKIKANNPNIEYCAQNTLVTTGGRELSAGKGGNGGKPGQIQPQVVPEGILRVGGPMNGTGLVAWIIDSGIDLDHPDLNVDINRGFDAVSSVAKGKSTYDDVHGHGTHVAGILAAIDNDRDVVGVAAGATVVPVRVLAASNWGYADDVIAGMDYTAKHASPYDVVNMSIWGWSHNRAMHDAAYNLAEIVPIVTISGNGGADINAEPTEPGHVEHANLFTVSAVYHDDRFTDFSNWGFSGDWNDCSLGFPDDYYPCATVDFSAPGYDVLSLKPGGDLASWWGTSMAAPHVAAIILLQQRLQPRPNSDGTAIGDPDSKPDPIVHH